MDTVNESYKKLRGQSFLLWMVPFLAIATYCFAVILMSRRFGASFNNLNPLDPSIPFDVSVFILRIIIVSCGTILFLNVGVSWAGIFRKKFINWTSFLSFASVLSVIVMICGCIIFHAFSPNPINRSKFLCILFILIAVGNFLFMLQESSAIVIEKKIKMHMVKFLFLEVILFGILICFFFWGKFFYEDLSFDGEEAYEIATSLRDNILPQMGFEHAETKHRYICLGLTGESGLILNYLYFFVHALFGVSSNVLKLLYIPIGALLLVFMNMIIGARGWVDQLFVSICSVLMLFLYSVVMFFYIAHNSYFVDVPLARWS